MGGFMQMIATLREQMSAELTRTDALRPLIWPISGCLLALVGTITAHGPEWVLISLSTFLALLVLTYIGAYGFFAFTDSDALRSEKYKLQKLAIEQGLYGDSEVGILPNRSNEALQLKIASSNPEDSGDA